jgi:dihydroxy-acid dehydratase
MLVSKSELAKRKKELKAKGGFETPESQTPWQQYFREKVQPFSEGMVLEDAPNYRGIAQKHTPRNNH